MTREDGDVVYGVNAHDDGEDVLHARGGEERDDVSGHVGGALGLLERLDSDGNEETTEVCAVDEVGPLGRVFAVAFGGGGGLDVVNVFGCVEFVSGGREESVRGCDGVLVSADVWCRSFVSRYVLSLSFCDEKRQLLTFSKPATAETQVRRCKLQP